MAAASQCCQRAPLSQFGRVCTASHMLKARLLHHAHIITPKRCRQQSARWLSGSRSSLVASCVSSSNQQQELAAVTAAPCPALAPSSTRHQPQLTGKERAALRARAEALARDKSLQRVQVGGQGITHNVLLAAMDILAKHEFLRIKLGEGCGLERKATASLLEGLLDAAAVGQVGFTITLYRQKGLPRPDNLLKAAAAVTERAG